LTRYKEVKECLSDWETFSSAQGVSFNDNLNEGLAGSLVGSDPPEHRHYRKILEKPLLPNGLAGVRSKIRDMANGIVANAKAKGTVEAVSDISSQLPIKLVAELVGLPAEGQSKMLHWASQGFNTFAPEGTPRVEQGIADIAEMTAFFTDPTLPDRILPNSWASGLDEAVKQGVITREQFCTFMQMNYTFAALDTTIHASSSMLYLLATHPDEWKKLKNKPSLALKAMNETLRLDGPAQAFSRVTTRDTELSGVPVRKGSRLFVSFAAANRDERHYSNPDVFDISRKSADHLGFGFDEHVCLGRNLATLELMEILAQLIEQVDRIELVDCERSVNNALRGFKRLNLRLS
jgi:cytochrome P450